MECIPCGKRFTGQACYDAHVVSAKHKKKVTSFGILNGATGTPPTLEDKMIVDLKHNINKCDVCDISFTLLESFKIHSFTREHAEKVLSGNRESDLSCNVVSSNSDFPPNETVSDNFDENAILHNFKEENKSRHALIYATCDVCNKTFSGFEPYKQHIESAPHLKKKQLQEGTHAHLPAFSCEPCKKVFSGQFPYNQHMSSEIHKKKMQQLDFLKARSSVVDSNSNMQVLKAEGNNSKTDNPWFCNLCDVQCSGIVPYQQHLNGAAHLKKKFEKEMQSIAPPSVNSVHQSKNDISCDNEQSEKMETDYILSGLEGRLNVISTEELKQSIKFFLPDDNIDFDIANNKQV